MRGDFPQKSVGKHNFNYCNESYRRGTESVAFVWSQHECVLASNAELIYHQPDGTVWYAVVERAIRNSAGRRSEQNPQNVKFRFSNYLQVCHPHNNHDYKQKSGTDNELPGHLDKQSFVYLENN